MDHRPTANGRLEGLPALTVVFAFLDATALIRFKHTARFAARAVNEKAAVVIHQRLQSHLWCTGFYGDNADLWLLVCVSQGGMYKERKPARICWQR